MEIKNMSRTEMEIEIMVSDILPSNTAADVAKLRAMTDDEMRAAIQSWIEAGDECGS